MSQEGAGRDGHGARLSGRQQDQAAGAIDRALENKR